MGILLGILLLILAVKVSWKLLKTVIVVLLFLWVYSVLKFSGTLILLIGSMMFLSFMHNRK